MASISSGVETSGDWQTKAADKRAKCFAAIPKAWLLPQSLSDTIPEQSGISKVKLDLTALELPRRSGILTEKELDITESYTVSTLLESLASGKLTSSEVTLAFSKRAAIAQQVTNCLTETFFEEAQQRARYLDTLREKGELAGPLHGLPVSLKDTYQVEGTEATIGAVAYIGRVSTENSALVNILLGLGAVLYVKTNSVDSDNNVFGRVLNPLNTMLTAGGSSGGDGALLAFRGSPLSAATDLAGSIRIPSLCCGTYGFKPSAGRVPYGKQVMPLNAGIGVLLPSAGPIANDIKALQIFMKTVIDAAPHRNDSTAFDLPWRNVIGSLGPKLRLALLAEDPLFPYHPPVKESLDEAVRRLQQHGQEVVFLDAAECHVAATTQVAMGLLSLDSTPMEIIASSGEPAVSSVKSLGRQSREIDWNFVPTTKDMDGLQKLGVLQNKRAELAEAWRKLWVKYGVDAVIGPTAQSTAVEHDGFSLPAYSTFLNVLNYPVCVIPFGKASSELEFVPKPGQGTCAYKRDVVEGAPCSIQVFTGGMRDEECLAVAEVVDQCLNKTEQSKL
ncbi:hypothetical protein S40288_01006 [Stachybotrys chartarum IBT 40288]|nr:hypothetical protein S40288_01006 [Stachybotrys chartarum IBT 40288]